MSELSNPQDDFRENSMFIIGNLVLFLQSDGDLNVLINYDIVGQLIVRLQKETKANFNYLVLGILTQLFEKSFLAVEIFTAQQGNEMIEDVMQYNSEDEELIELCQSILIKYFKRTDLIQENAPDAPATKFDI